MVHTVIMVRHQSVKKLTKNNLYTILNLKEVSKDTFFLTKTYIYIDAYKMQHIIITFGCIISNNKKKYR